MSYCDTTHTLTNSLTLSLIHSFTHTLIHSLIRSLIHSLTLSPDKALEELEKMMVLLLGCAVQCENKAALIQKMMAMEQQRGLVPYIQQVSSVSY